MDSTLMPIHPSQHERLEPLPDFTFSNEVATTKTDLQLSQQSDGQEINYDLRRRLAEILGIIVI
ncbi:hypothetical protein [Deinococcus aquatilis]|uniref:hypothetical protein n=1 Tax=Deinococcus aquatilis TaxID=519440 RepID=UPI0012F85BD0|nr:hypothetical protein [Deinococcus aquatilis]